MKTPPKRSMKVYKKMDMLTRLKRGEAMTLKEPISQWRQAVNLHQAENKSIFGFRTTPKGMIICREK